MPRYVQLLSTFDLAGFHYRARGWKKGGNNDLPRGSKLRGLTAPALSIIARDGARERAPYRAHPIMDRSRNPTTFQIRAMKEWHYAHSAVRRCAATAVARYRATYQLVRRSIAFLFIALVARYDNWISLKSISSDARYRTRLEKFDDLSLDVIGIPSRNMPMLLRQGEASVTRRHFPRIHVRTALRNLFGRGSVHVSVYRNLINFHNNICINLRNDMHLGRN